jgi:L-aminopeptidase/D-esterase-like protein
VSGALPVPIAPTVPPVASLAAVRGLRVGHHTDAAAGTGCTVVLGPPGGMRASCAVRGRAAGTRQMDALDPRHLVEHVDAILLTGGSAYGLGAADGVVGWLRQRDRGFPVGPAGRVPIVPCAVLFDLGAQDGAPAWPTAADAARACDAAGDAIAEGSVGAGTGATVGKACGAAGSMKGGLGTWAVQSGAVVVAALVVVNAFGDVHDGSGAVLAGARGKDGHPLNAVRYLAGGGVPLGRRDQAENTTLAVVATNAALARSELREVAWAACDALARRIAPFGTALDGDVVFAVSTATESAASPLQVEALAALCVPQAVERAVRLARGTARVPGLADPA